MNFTRLLQRSALALGVAVIAADGNNRLRRAAGDIGLLRGGFRDHLGVLVSHDRVLSEGASFV